MQLKMLLVDSLEVKYKFLLLGDAGSGKTRCFHRITQYGIGNEYVFDKITKFHDSETNFNVCQLEKGNDLAVQIIDMADGTYSDNNLPKSVDGAVLLCNSEQELSKWLTLINDTFKSANELFFVSVVTNNELTVDKSLYPFCHIYTFFSKNDEFDDSANNLNDSINWLIRSKGNIRP